MFISYVANWAVFLSRSTDRLLCQMNNFLSSALFQADYGHVVIPDNFEPPKERSIGVFQDLTHGLKVDDIILKDSRTVFLKNFHYDGKGPSEYHIRNAMIDGELQANSVFEKHYPYPDCFYKQDPLLTERNSQVSNRW